MVGAYKRPLSWHTLANASFAGIRGSNSPLVPPHSALLGPAAPLAGPPLPPERDRATSAMGAVACSRGAPIGQTARSPKSFGL